MAEIQQSLSTDARTASTRLVLVGEFVKEFKKLSRIAAPMVGIFLFDYLLQVVSTMMVGHLGQLQLASVAIATSVTNVVGFSFLLGILGAAAAFSLSTWLNVVLVSPYVMYSSSCKDTRAKLSKEAFLAIKQFFAFGLPSALMLCLRWWSMEMLILSSGFLPNPRLETSGLSICLAITTLHFIIPYGIGAAARVSNELGAGNPEAARRAAWSAVFVATLEAVIASTILFSCRFIVGYAYSNDKQVVDFIAAMTPLICLSIILDTLHAVFQGVSRGCGWQHIGACINFVAFYLVGLPVGGVLGFVVHLRGKGLWTGIVVGSAVQSTLLCLITCFTNWNKQATKAKERLRERGRSSAA
ncbi:protein DETOXIFICATION 2 [Citrus sinensis]|nr:protein DETOXIFICATION 2 [Citrus sinensis]